MLKSPAFNDGGKMPKKHTIDGGSTSPPLQWGDPPKGTKSFALLMEDLDVPPEYGGMFIHWMVADIPAACRSSEEGKIPAGSKSINNMYAGSGKMEFAQYGPPWPPGSHRYKFTLYSLNAEKLGLAADAGFQKFKEAVDAYKLGAESLIGVYGPAETPPAW